MKIEVRHPIHYGTGKKNGVNQVTIYPRGIYQTDNPAGLDYMPSILAKQFVEIRDPHSSVAVARVLE
jgi:hypothetical protein